MAVPLPGGRPGGQRGKLTTVVGAVRCRPWLLACPELSASSLPPPSPGRAMGMRVSHWRVRNKSCIQCGSSEPRNSKSKPWRVVRGWVVSSRLLWLNALKQHRPCWGVSWQPHPQACLLTLLTGVKGVKRKVVRAMKTSKMCANRNPDLPLWEGTLRK